MKNDLSITTRVSQFGDLIKRTVITDSKGVSLELEGGLAQLCDRLVALRETGSKL
jgi:hypothetical protein